MAKKAASPSSNRHLMFILAPYTFFESHLTGAEQIVRDESGRSLQPLTQRLANL